MSAPATEVVITIQFGTPMRDINALEISDLYAQFSSLFPMYSQVPPAGPMAFKMTHLEGLEPLNLHTSSIPRIRMSDPERGRSLSVQSDRVTYGWERSSPLDQPDGYPGFDVLLAEFRELWPTLTAWVSAQTSLEVEPHVGEVVYVNAFPTVHGEEPIRISKLFAFLSSDMPPRPVRTYNYSWVELLEAPEGLLNLSVAGPAVASPSIPVAVLTMTGTFLISDASAQWDNLLQVRSRINTTFHGLVRQESVKP